MIARRGQGTAVQEQAVLNEILTANRPQTTLLNWQYHRDAIILGKSQKPSDGMQRRAGAMGLDLVVRNSGGGAVYASTNLVSLSVVAPADSPLSRSSIPQSFCVIGQVWQSVLKELGVETKMVTQSTRHQLSESAPHQSLAWACFASLSYGELTDLAGRKLLGLAQVRKTTGVAVVMGLYLHPPDWAALAHICQEESKPHAASRLADLTVSLNELSDLTVTPADLARHFYSEFLHTIHTMENHTCNTG